jgi:hypothetical protein
MDFDSRRTEDIWLEDDPAKKAESRKGNAGMMPEKVLMAERALAKGNTIILFGENKAPVDAQSVIFSELVDARVVEMRKEGDTEPEHVLMKLAAQELRAEGVKSSAY